MSEWGKINNIPEIKVKFIKEGEIGFSFLYIQDGSGPPLPTAYEPEPLAKYGTLDVAFEYDSSEQWLAVTVTAATDIPALKQTGNISWQVHLVLLPTKKQRAKTGVQKGPCPIFTETFKFSRVEQEALGDYAVRFRLYSIRRMKKEKVLGEKVFYLTKLNLQGKIALPVTLEPGSELTVRTLLKYTLHLKYQLYTISTLFISIFSIPSSTHPCRSSYFIFYLSSY